MISCFIGAGALPQTSNQTSDLLASGSHCGDLDPHQEALSSFTSSNSASTASSEPSLEAAG